MFYRRDTAKKYVSRDKLPARSLAKTDASNGSDTKNEPSQISCATILLTTIVGLSDNRLAIYETYKRAVLFLPKVFHVLQSLKELFYSTFLPPFSRATPLYLGIFPFLLPH